SASGRATPSAPTRGRREPRRTWSCSSVRPASSPRRAYRGKAHVSVTGLCRKCANAPRGGAMRNRANKLGFLAPMKVGVVKEIKSDEYRVALTPAGARELVERGHDVLVERGAGDGSSFPDDAYEVAGATLGSADKVWGDAELLLKVKEPLPSEYSLLRDGLVLFTYLHLAASEELTRALAESGATCVAYETVETNNHALPLLAPMSEIAGRLSAQAGAYFLEKP